MSWPGTVAAVGHEVVHVHSLVSLDRHRCVLPGKPNGQTGRTASHRTTLPRRRREMVIRVITMAIMMTIKGQLILIIIISTVINVQHQRLTDLAVKVYRG